jgi:hypothetical protein
MSPGECTETVPRRNRALPFVGISRADLEFAIRYGLHADGRLVDGHHIVELGYFTRSGSYQWRFDLDAPCEN